MMVPVKQHRRELAATLDREQVTDSKESASASCHSQSWLEHKFSMKAWHTCLRFVHDTGRRNGRPT